MAIDQLGELLESSLHDLRPIPEGLEPKPGGRYGVGVTVDSVETNVGSRAEQRSRVACATDRAIDDQSHRYWQEELHDLPNHHREM
jgi:hypothetical protein